MKRYRHILLGCDFSKNFSSVVERASTLARQQKARLTLLHVVEPLPSYGYAFTGASEVELGLINAGKEKLKQQAEELKIADEDAHLELGSAKVHIVDFASNHDCDLIILGSHNHSPLLRLLGSTATSVIARAHCDVLTVRIDEQDD